MAYRVQAGESPAKSVKRIARDQIDKAREDLKNEDRVEGVHGARKRLKKLRALLRLVREETGEDFYSGENARFRDMGREISGLRDAQVMSETLDKLLEHFSDQLDAEAFSHARAEFARREEAVMDSLVDHQNTLDRLDGELADARKRVKDWPVDTKKFKAYKGGLKRVYRRGRDRFGAAYEADTAEAFHDWRKRVKYLWHHHRILTPLCPDVLEEAGEQAHEIANLIGDDHDLMVLIDTVNAEPSAFGGQPSADAITGLARIRSRALREEAKPIAEKLYAETPKAFVKRIKTYWKAWKKQK